MHVHLNCPWVRLPRGVRLLGTDGQSFMLNGADPDSGGRLEVPTSVGRQLQTLGLVRRPTAPRVAVVTSEGYSQALADALTARDMAVSQWSSQKLGTGVQGWRSRLTRARDRIDLVVVCPTFLLGGRDVIENCRDLSVPSVLAWAHRGWAVLGPLNGRGPGCQHCCDLAMAARDPDWVTTAAALSASGSDPGAVGWLAWRAEEIVGAIIDDRPVGEPTTALRTPLTERRLTVPAQPGCQCSENSCSTSMRSAA